MNQHLVPALFGALSLGACIYVDAPTDGTADAAAPRAAPVRDAATDSSAPPPPAPVTPPVDSGADAPPPGVKALVGVGYGGLRVVSRDNGVTWITAKVETQGGGDDDVLLRAVAWASGRWLAVGWGATMSDDGVTWSPIAKINQPDGVTWEGAGTCGLVEGLTSDGTAFYAACAGWEQPTHAFRSEDGTHWVDLGVIGDVGGHPALAHRDGTFYAYGDRGVSFRSTDARTWTQDDSLDRATYCENAWKSREACHDSSWFDGAFYQGEWQSKIRRSTDGVTFERVHDDPSNNTLYQGRAVAQGWVRP